MFSLCSVQDLVGGLLLFQHQTLLYFQKTYVILIAFTYNGIPFWTLEFEDIYMK